LREAVLQPQVFTEAGGVLANQVDFTHSLLEEAHGFRNYGFKPPAAERAPILRNHAKRARMVAAFGNFDVGEVSRRGENARCEVVVEVRCGGGRRFGVIGFAQRHDAVQFVRADQRVHFGQFFADIATVAFHQAAGHNQLARLPHPLVLGHFQDGVNGFLLGRIDEAARIDHQHLGLVGV